MCPARVKEGSKRGFIVPIGGGEDKLRDQNILSRFIDLCGRDATLAVIPTASELDDTGSLYRELFLDLGAGKVEILDCDDRKDCNLEAQEALLDDCDGVFITGGNQLRLSTMIGGTLVAQGIRRRNAEGMHVAGTSAGAAFVPEHMIAGGDEGSTPSPGMVTLAPGLGLTNSVVIDQHFRERDRLGRLLTALAYNPFAIGIGLDEDTAAFIGPDNVFEVAGSGGITIVDPGELEYSSMNSARSRDPVSLIGVRLHILVEGGSYDIGQREARP